MRKLMILVLLAAATISAGDSPLVALAKRTNRKASKTPVITNDTVAKSKGRLSAAGGDATASTGAQPARTASPSYSQPEASTARKESTPASTAAPNYPSTTVRTIQPQSTAATLNPSSTARTIQASSGAGKIAAQSTAQTVRPASTAQTSRPSSTAQNIPTPPPPQQ